MKIVIKNSSEKPIYDQVASQIKEAIVQKALLPGEQLPSIRLLAKEIRVSVITTKRAYEELEREGFITSVAGKGSFVADQTDDFIRETYLTDIQNHLEEVVRLARAANIKRSELEMIINLLEETYE